jgi:RND family efflux transporter MFP subunit
MLRQTFLVLVLVSSVAACDKGGDKKDVKAAVSAPMLIAVEDLYTLQRSALTSGPAITGTIQPERRADLRAEVSTVVLQVLKENGEAVKRGDVLVRLDDTAIRDSLNSAEEAARAAGQSLEQAERQFQRLKTLRASGMTSTQSLDDAETRSNNAQSDLSAAKTRAVQARQQLQHTLVRAPFDGVVSERRASAGDTASIGKELIKVVDPTSMRFEGLVSADKINQVRIGQPVSFRVNGYGQEQFSGKVKRVDPAANPVTRQVEVLVEFAANKLPKVSGLYAEGIIEADSVQTLTVPETALVRNGDKVYAWRLEGDRLKKVAIVIGERDPRRGDFPLKSGLAAGDKLIRSPLITFKEGEKVQMAAPVAAAAAAPATTAKLEK